MHHPVSPQSPGLLRALKMHGEQDRHILQPLRGRRGHCPSAAYLLETKLQGREVPGAGVPQGGCLEEEG